MKLKVCGMKYQDNIEAVANLQPDYLGFIFHEESPRHFEGIIPKIPSKIKKVGVFVDKTVAFISSRIAMHKLDAVQLHGHESPEICLLLQSANVEVIKVFSIKDEFDFRVLNAYEDAVDYFLFDTKGKLPGGNGYTFDWSVLNDYTSNKPFFLSGGIGIEEIDKINAFKQSPASKYCYALDVNSRFEIAPGLKKEEKIKKFKNKVITSDN